MKIKVFIDTNALRSISFNDKYFESLNLLANEGEFDFIIPFFVYREYLKYRKFQVIDEVTKILHSTKKLQKELNVVRISCGGLNEINNNILSGDAINTIEKEIVKNVDAKFSCYNVLKKFPDNESLQEAFSQYFNKTRIFSGVQDPKEHLPDAIIIEEIKKNGIEPGSFLICNDKKLFGILNQQFKEIIHCANIEEFIKNSLISNKLDKIKQNLIGKNNARELALYLESNDYEKNAYLHGLLDSEVFLKNIEFEENGLTLSGIVDLVHIDPETITLDYQNIDYLGEGRIYIQGGLSADVDCSMDVYMYDLPILGLSVPADDDVKNVEVSLSKTIWLDFELEISVPVKHLMDEEFKKNIVQKDLDDVIEEFEINIELNDSWIRTVD